MSIARRAEQFQEVYSWASPSIVQSYRTCVQIKLLVRAGSCAVRACWQRMVPLFSPPHQPLDMYVFDAAQRGAGGGYVTRCIKRAGRPRDVKKRDLVS